MLVSLGLAITFCVATVWLANKRGYNPLIWFFASGAIGLGVLVLLPDTNLHTVPDTEITRICRKGNLIGIGIISIVTLAVVFVIARAR